MSLALTPAERTAFAHLWSLADPRQSGVLVGDQAVKFFTASRLPPATLGQIWAIADSGNVGFLTPSSFGTALRLISHAQQGQPVTPALASNPTTPPVFEGISYPSPQPPPSRSASVISAPRTNTTIAATPVGPDAAAKSRFARIFANSGPVAGLLDGSTAKDIFLKSQLPVEKLAQVWNLADTHSRGALDLTDFTIAMYYIQGTMNGSIPALPASLPPGLYEQVSGGQSLPGSFTPARTPSRGYTPVQPHRAPSVVQRAPSRHSVASFSPPVAPQRTGTISRSATGLAHPTVEASTAWDITPGEQANANRFFDSLDVGKTGQLQGSLAVPFFLQSKLDEATLARVWDLADITQTGTLSRDEFAVAMHLVNRSLTGTEVPHTLPPSLVPPSLRGQVPSVPVNPQTSNTQQDSFTGQVAGTVPFSAQGAFARPASTRPASTRRLSQASTPFDAAFDESLLPSASRSRQPSIHRSTSAFDAAFDSSFAQPAQHTVQRNLVSTTPARRMSVATNIPPSQPLSPQPLSAQPPSAHPLSPDQTTSVFPRSVARGTSSTSAAPAAAERSAPESSAVFLEAAERELEKVQAQRTKIQQGITSDEDAVAEMRARLNIVGGEIDDEQKLLDELNAKVKGESEALHALKAQLTNLENQQTQLHADKQELLAQMESDKAQIATANDQLKEVQGKSAALTQEIEALKSELAKKKEAETAAAAAAAAAEAAKKREQEEALKKKQDEEAAAAKKVQEQTVAAPAAAPTSSAPAVSRDLPATETKVASPAPAPAAAFSPVSSERSTNPFDNAFFPTQQSTPSAAPLVGGALAGGALGAAVAAFGHHDESTSAPEHAQPAPTFDSSFDDAFGEPFGAAPAAPTSQAPTQTQAPDFGQAFSFDETTAFGQPQTVVPQNAPQTAVTETTSKAAEPNGASQPAPQSFTQERDVLPSNSTFTATADQVESQGVPATATSAPQVEQPISNPVETSKSPEQKNADILASAPDFATAADEIEREDPAPYTEPVPVQVQLVSDPQLASDPPEWGESKEYEVQAERTAAAAVTAPGITLEATESTSLPVAADPQSRTRDLAEAPARTAPTGFDDDFGNEFGVSAQQNAPTSHGFDNGFALAPAAVGAGLAGAAPPALVAANHNAEPARSLTPLAGETAEPARSLTPLSGETEPATSTDAIVESETSEVSSPSAPVAPSAPAGTQDAPLGFEGEFGVQAPTAQPAPYGAEPRQPIDLNPEERALLPTAGEGVGVPSEQEQQMAQAEARALSSVQADPALVTIPSSQPLGASEPFGEQTPDQGLFDPSHLATGAHSDQVGLTDDVVPSPSAHADVTPATEPEAAPAGVAVSSAPALVGDAQTHLEPQAESREVPSGEPGEPKSAHESLPLELAGAGAAGAASLAAVGFLHHEQHPTTEAPIASQPNLAAQPVAAEVPTEHARSTEPAAAAPVSFEPVAAEPNATGPVAAAPNATGPVATEPDATGSVATEPVATEPVATELPIAEEARLGGPTAAEPAAVDPVTADHLLSETGERTTVPEGPLNVPEELAKSTPAAAHTEGLAGEPIATSSVPLGEEAQEASDVDSMAPVIPPVQAAEDLPTSETITDVPIAGGSATAPAPVEEKKLSQVPVVPDEVAAAQGDTPLKEGSVAADKEGLVDSAEIAAKQDIHVVPGESANATTLPAVSDEKTASVADEGRALAEPNGQEKVAFPSTSEESESSSRHGLSMGLAVAGAAGLGLAKRISSVGNRFFGHKDSDPAIHPGHGADASPETGEVVSQPAETREAEPHSTEVKAEEPTAPAARSSVPVTEHEEEAVVVSAVANQPAFEPSATTAAPAAQEVAVPDTSMDQDTLPRAQSALGNEGFEDAFEIPQRGNTADFSPRASNDTPTAEPSVHQAPVPPQAPARRSPPPVPATRRATRSDTASSADEVFVDALDEAPAPEPVAQTISEEPEAIASADIAEPSSIAPELHSEPAASSQEPVVKTAFPPVAPESRSAPPHAEDRGVNSSVAALATDTSHLTVNEPESQAPAATPAAPLADFSAFDSAFGDGFSTVPAAKPAESTAAVSNPEQPVVKAALPPVAAESGSAVLHAEDRGVDPSVAALATHTSQLTVNEPETQVPAAKPAAPLADFSAFDSAFGDDFSTVPAVKPAESTAAASIPEQSVAETATRTPSTTKSRRVPPPVPKAKAETPLASAAAAPTSDDPFGSSFAAPATKTQGSAPAVPALEPMDDFAASFADFDRSFPPPTASGVQASTFEDSFDNDFTFAPSFGTATQAKPSSPSGPTRTTSRRQPPPPPSKSASSTAATGAVSSKGAPVLPVPNLDSGFAFDDSFGTTDFGSSAAVPTASRNDSAGFTFDGSFAPAKSSAPAAAPVPKERPPTPAMADDIPLVKRLAAMGFSRSAVVNALELANYRQERALEILLGN